VSFATGDGSFSFVRGDDATENVDLAFAVADAATVEGFHAFAVDAGYRSNGEPGQRPQYHAGYHAADVLDPDGHNVEAVFHDRR
jgi:catechol 2,3-dioxygenase-like lactoylglutathione lyase family enzyme